MAVAAIDQPEGLTRLEGQKTIEGPVTVTSDESVTQLTVTRSGKDKPIVLTIGRPPVLQRNARVSEANDL
jgi:hypothetical protein